MMKTEYARYGFLISLFALAVAVLVLATYFIRQFLPPSYEIRTDGAAVVTELKKLQRLETASFTIEKIIEAGTHGNVFQEFLYGDRILLIANGEVVAGIELSGISEDDIERSGTTITLNLPAPTILTTRLDSGATRVYNRSTGLFTSGDKNLESRARAAAEDSIREAACAGGILDEAAENGTKELEALLRGFGFSEATVNIPQGSCS